MGRGRLPEGALSGSVVSGQKPLPSWREKPMAHLRLGAGASWVEIAVRPHVCLGPLCCLFSSLTHPLFSGLGMFHAVPGAQGGDSKEEGVNILKKQSNHKSKPNIIVTKSEKYSSIK